MKQLNLKTKDFQLKNLLQLNTKKTNIIVDVPNDVFFLVAVVLPSFVK